MTVLGLIAVAAVSVAFALVGDVDRSRVLLPHDGKVVIRGERIYAEHCASCHGTQLEGEPNWRQRDKHGYLPAPPHDASGHTWHHGDEQLFKLTKYGLAGLTGGDYKTRMPTYEGVLSDDDIIAVLSFIKSRWPSDIRKRHDQLNAAAKREG